MRYKYYIYRENVGSTDKFIEANYSMYREIIPAGKWELNYEEDDDWRYKIRWQFSGELVLTGDDYHAVMAILDDCRHLYIQIRRECDGTYEDLWKGFFSKYDMIIDEDRCILSIKPTVFDKYTRMMGKFKEKFNIMDVENIYTSVAEVYGYPLEYYVQAGQYTMGWPAWAPPVWHEHPVVGDEYYLYLMRVYPKNLYNALGQLIYNYYTERIYAREWTTNDDPINPPGGDPTWQYDSEVSTGVYKWVRPVGNSLYNTYDHVVDGDIDAYVLSGYSTAVGSVFDIWNCRRLVEVFEYWLAAVALDFYSELLTDPNPMGGNPLDNLMLVSTGEMYHYSDMTTKQEITFEQLLLNLKELIPVEWYVDDSNVFHLEHISYFYNGFSYTPPAVVTLDLTSANYLDFIRKKNKYEFKEPPNYLYEEWNVINSQNVDFKGEKILYDCNIEGVKKHESILSTDIWWLYVHRNELPRDGWILLHTYWDVIIYKVYNEVGYLTGALLSNAHLAVSNLQERYWTWDRCFPSGKMNGRLVDFDSWEQRKIQIELTFPACCDDIDLTGLIRTELGDGSLHKATYIAQTGMMKIIVKYE